MTTNKGFIKDQSGNILLPITRGELLLDSQGQMALFSEEFIATAEHAGLMTSAEKAMLSGSGAGNSLSDVYTKLGYINSGIHVGTTDFHFYKSDGSKDPFIIASDNSITLTPNANTNTLTIGLQTLAAKNIENTIIRNIIVDTYGRVTAVSGSNLANDDIPTTLEGKTLKNCIVSNDTDKITEQSAVNKKYVDDKITLIENNLTGALIFDGYINNSDTAISALKEQNLNRYYKVTQDINNFSSQYIHDLGATQVNVKKGDTLIVWKKGNEIKFVHVPSGDDVTSITVQQNEVNTTLTSAYGDIALNFASPLSVSATAKRATISIPQVTTTTDGYLSANDYNEFKNFVSVGHTTVSYNSSLGTTFNGQYELGKLTINGTEVPIYGKNNTSTLKLINGSNNNASNPIIEFKETDAGTTNITFIGTDGVSIQKDDNNNIKITSPNRVTEGGDYLTITNYNEFKLKIATIGSDSTTDGLVSLPQVISLITNYTHTFEIITESLNGTASDDEYRYGNQKLKDAINVTI